MTKIFSNKINQFYVTLIVSVVVIVAQWFLMKNIKTSGVWEWLISSLFLFFVLPAIIIKYHFRKSLKEFHLSLSFNFKDVLFVFISGIFFIGLFSLLLVKLNWFKFFSASNLMFGGKGPFMFFEFIVFPVVLFFQEFFFRGFLFRSAEKAMGIKWAVFVQLLIVLVFEYIFGAPLNFVAFFSVLVTTLFIVWLILKTRTIFLTFLVNWGINIAINFIVYYYLI